MRGKGGEGGVDRGDNGETRGQGGIAKGDKQNWKGFEKRPEERKRSEGERG